MLSLAGRFLFSFHRLKEAQENIKKITAEKRVETKKVNANSLVRADLYSETKWNFPKAALSCVAAEIDTLNLFVVLANRKRGCDRRKPACPPAEQISGRAEEARSGGGAPGRVQGPIHPAVTTCLSSTGPYPLYTVRTHNKTWSDFYYSHCRICAPLTALNTPSPSPVLHRLRFEAFLAQPQSAKTIGRRSRSEGSHKGQRVDLIHAAWRDP